MLRPFFFLMPMLALASLVTACTPDSSDSADADTGTASTDSVPPASEPTWIIRKDFGAAFSEAGLEGCIIIHNRNTNEYLAYDSARCVTGFSPASTFKVFNALVGLETGAVSDENEVIPWDSVERSLAEWNRDHTLRSGMRYSTVWFYQELARRIGRERMQSFLDRADYGNHTIGDTVDAFWLDGSLRISPLEEVQFLRRLAAHDLPFSDRSMDIVHDIITLETTDDYIYKGKTGWALGDSVNVGWFVGMLERDGNLYTFATNVEMTGWEDIQKRQGITRRILMNLGLIGEEPPQAE